MPLILTKDSKILDKSGKRVSKDYKYMFEPIPSCLEGFPNIGFSGLIPNDTYFELLRDRLTRLKITGPLNMLIEPDLFYAELFAKCHPDYRRAEQSKLPEKSLNNLFKGLKKVSKSTGGFFTANSEPPAIVLNCDAPNREEALTEELLHILVLRRGWLNPLDKAYHEAGNSLLPQHNHQGEVLFMAQSTIIDHMSKAIAVELNMPEFYTSSAEAFVGRIKNQQPTLHSAFINALGLVSKTVPPANFKNGKEFLDSLEDRIKCAVNNLHPLIRPLVPKFYNYFQEIELPPRTPNLFKCIGRVFGDYLNLPHKEMEYEDKLSDPAVPQIEWKIS